MSRKASKNPKELDNRFAAMEICATHIHLALAERKGEEDVHVRTHSVAWRQEASSLHSDTGKAELTAAFKKLSSQFHLSDYRLFACLHGDFCVTRVITGETDRVKKELNQLEQRSNLYLSLGHGQKTVGGSVRQIDARHEHALMTVVNQKTVDVLMEVAQRAGMGFEVVEPSLVSLARFVGFLGADEESPKLIVNPGEQGIEVGICQNGQLILDYRPACHGEVQEVAAKINGHLGRLQRYCDRYVSFADGKVDEVFLCGANSDVQAVGEAFVSESTMDVSVMDPSGVADHWVFEGDAPSSELSAAVGTLIFAISPRLEESPPNVLEKILALKLEPLKPLLIKTFWPVAAAVFGWILLEGVAFYQSSRVSSATDEVAALQAETTELDLLESKIQTKQKRIMELRNVAKGVTSRNWGKLMSEVGAVKPPNMWFENISVGPDGSVRIAGATSKKGEAYDFVKSLKGAEGFQNVSIGGTDPKQTAAGLVIKFEVRCELAGYTE